MGFQARLIIRNPKFLQINYLWQYCSHCVNQYRLQLHYEDLMRGFGCSMKSLPIITIFFCYPCVGGCLLKVNNTRI